MGLYILLTVPLLALMGFAAYVLWLNAYWLTLIYIGFFVLTNLFQSYYCAHINCPYIGRACPAVAGIMLSAFIAEIWKKIKLKTNKKLANVFATLGSLMLLGLIVFPLYWLFVYHVVAIIGFLIGILIYGFAFLMIICPACASRESCP
jgi:hypothetical protein